MARQVRHIYARVEHVTTILFLTFVLWYLFAFTPNVQVSSRLYVDGKQFTFVNFSYKPEPWANLFCGIPSQAVLIFADQFGNSHAMDDKSEKGTGSSEISRWEMTGYIPDRLEPGHVTVHKRLRYPCAFGITKTIDSPEHVFTLDENGFGSLTQQDLDTNRPNN